MKQITISIIFHVDVKHSLYVAAYEDAARNAAYHFDRLWAYPHFETSELMRPQYTITYAIID